MNHRRRRGRRLREKPAVRNRGHAGRGDVARLIVAEALLLVVAGIVVGVPLALGVSRLAGSRESPTFGGYSWPGVGQYEKLVGKAFGEVDPTDPQNSVIVDILLAPRNAKGHVE